MRDEKKEFVGCRLSGVRTTRREIIKSGLGLAGIIAAGRAPAALVRSMVAAREGAWARAGGDPYIGKNIILVSIGDDAELKDVSISDILNDGSPVSVDWGDGASSTTSGTSISHVYSAPGDYVIEIDGHVRRFGCDNHGVARRANRVTGVYLSDLANDISSQNSWRNNAALEFVRCRVPISGTMMAFFSGSTLLSEFPSISGVTEITGFGGTFWNTRVERASLDVCERLVGSVFRACHQLTEVTNLTRLESLGANCFYDSPNIVKSGSWPAVPPTLENVAAAPMSGVIMIPRGSRSAYESATYWSNHKSQFEEIDL